MHLHLLEQNLEQVRAQCKPSREKVVSATSCATLQVKRRVGRPIAYHGDPNSPHLTPAERRRMKRRVANRESARRVRARRFMQIDAMAIKVVIPAVSAVAVQVACYIVRKSRTDAQAGYTTRGCCFVDSHIAAHVRGPGALV